MMSSGIILVSSTRIRRNNRDWFVAFKLALSTRLSTNEQRCFVHCEAEHQNNGQFHK